MEGLPGGERNAFSADLEAFLDQNDLCNSNIWGPLLAQKDSDKDGRTNGEELMDPLGTWKPGDPNPGNPDQVTSPGEFDEHSEGQLEVEPNSLMFGEVELENSAIQELVLKNVGDWQLKINEASLVDSSAFKILNSPLVETIAAGSQATLSIEFTPISIGTNNATLQIKTNISNQELLQIQLSGIGKTKPELFNRGDSNQDQTIDTSDSIYTLVFLFLGTVQQSCLDSLDFDDSGLIDISDPIANLSYLFLGGTPPPGPAQQTCGQDTTADELNCESFLDC